MTRSECCRLERQWVPHGHVNRMTIIWYPLGISWHILKPSEGLQCVYIVYINHFLTLQSVAGTLIVKISCNVLFPWWREPLTKYINALPRTWFFRKQIYPLPSCFKWHEEWEDSDMVKWARNQTEIQTVVPDNVVMHHQCHWFPVQLLQGKPWLRTHIGKHHINFSRQTKWAYIAWGRGKKKLVISACQDTPFEI